MNDSIELFSEIFALSGCSWALFGLYTIFRVQWFIVKRYEQETKLLDTVFFKEHLTFSKYAPNFFSSAFYGAHLLMCVWGWWLYGKRKIFRDIEDPQYVTQHFSKKEIRHVKWVIISGLIFFPMASHMSFSTIYGLKYLADSYFYQYHFVT
jgi:hypothetical protein